MNKKIKQKGFALNIAVFFLVVGALLIATMMWVINRSNDINVLDVLEVKAGYSARTGLSHAFALINESTPNCPTMNTTYSLPDGFYYTIRCSSITQNEAGVDTTYFQVYSVGCNNSNCPISGVPPKDYVEKEFKAVYLK